MLKQSSLSNIMCSTNTNNCN